MVESLSERFITVKYNDLLELSKDAATGIDFEKLICEFSNHGINKDVEDFLKNKAGQYDKMHMAKTYLVLDKGLTCICGYFSVVARSLIIKKKDWQKLSNNKKKVLNPFGYRKDEDQNIPAILLGQLGKNWNSNLKISGFDLLNIAITTCKEVSDTVGGRYLYLEADDNEKLASFYTDNGFSYLSYPGGEFYHTKNDQVLFIMKFG
ncbi:GNAT family acetyltransferase [Weissella minor]|uniref:GNAT family acetyltransferase n=1 Tax=Weissella minor TaxID=1620 RepID=UPI001BAEBA28|nr:GNAT family acetyltransferase [Weissella minor]MBS0950040.1 GNAT family acetyltransferase [Weissella minor]